MLSILLAGVAVMWLEFSAMAAPLYRPEQTRREIDTGEYRLIVQKNGQIDLRSGNGEPIINNGFPVVEYSGGKRGPLDVDYRRSERTAIRNPLGQGNGFLFRSDNAEWHVATYPTQPFLTIDLTYINDTKNPVEISRLSPLDIGQTGRGAIHLGPGGDSIWILQPPGAGESFATMVHETEASPGHFGACNTQTGQVLVAGFLTHHAGPGVLSLARSSAKSGGPFDRFRADVLFDPPVTVAPGERLEADTLYLGIVDRDPQEALERFALASQRLEPYPSGSELHGWLPRVNEVFTDTQLEANLAVAGESLARYGWSNVILRASIESSLPNSLEALCAMAHGRTMNTTLSTSTLPANADDFVAYLRQCSDSGVDTLELPSDDAARVHPRAHFAAIEDHDLTRPRLVYAKPAAPANNGLTDWALASRQYYLPPVGNPFLSGHAHTVIQDTPDFTDHQFITAWTLAAMQGALLRPATPYTELAPLRRLILSRLLPAPSASARPLDLFQEGLPRRWVLPLDTKAGHWTIVALFNWDREGASQLDTPLRALGLNNDNIYTVYDYWAGQYLGLIEDELRAEIPAEGVRLFGLRRYEKHPMLVASNRHFTQGASDHINVGWSFERQALAGSFEGIADTKYTLTVLVPEPYRVQALDTTHTITEHSKDGAALTFSILVEHPGKVIWKVECAAEVEGASSGTP